jgi:hypothetical protein
MWGLWRCSQRREEISGIIKKSLSNKNAVCGKNIR